MAENFLEEQLKRIREMTEHMTRVRNQAAEVSREVARNRAMIKRSPLHQVRDFRSYSSIGSERPASAEDHGARSTPRSASRGRRK
jgi:hypothetical protein